MSIIHKIKHVHYHISKKIYFDSISYASVHV